MGWQSITLTAFLPDTGTRGTLDGLNEFRNCHRIEVQSCTAYMCWECLELFYSLAIKVPAVSEHERQELAIAHVGRHFVQVFLHLQYPVLGVAIWVRIRLFVRFDSIRFKANTGLKKWIRLINGSIRFDSFIKWIESEFEFINSFIRLGFVY